MRTHGYYALVEISETESRVTETSWFGILFLAHRCIYCRCVPLSFHFIARMVYGYAIKDDLLLS